MINYQQYYEQEIPYHLVTILAPEIEIRLISPEIEPQTITSSDGATYVYQPGLLSIPTVQHRLTASSSNQVLEFYIPRHYSQEQTIYPVDISWAEATVEIAHWFLGTEFEDRRVLYTGKIENVNYGAYDEPVAADISFNVQDSGLLFDENTRITSETWPDVADLPSTSQENYDPTARRRAYSSENQYYGEIIGFPTYSVARVVENDVEAEHGSITYTPFKALICDGLLKNNTARTNCVLHASQPRTNWRFTPNLTPYEGADAKNRAVTLVNLQDDYNISTNLLWHPSSITTDKEFYGALWPNGKGVSLSLGDLIKQEADDDTFYRIVVKFDDNHPEDSTYYGVFKMDEEYGGLAAEESATATYIPLIAEDNKVFIKGSLQGGRAKLTDPGTVLRDAPDVIYEYLLRTQDITLDHDSLRRLGDTWLTNYKIDGQLLEQMSPLEWLRRDIYPLLPVAETVGPKGYSVYLIDTQDINYKVELNLGRSGLDGDRISRLSTTSTSEIINTVTVNSAWNPERERYNSQYLMDDTTINWSIANISAYAFNGLRAESIRKYGKRTVVVDTKWVNDATTSRLIQHQLVSRFHKPRWVLNYSLNRRYGYLKVGDLVKFTDSELNITDQLARIIGIRYDLDRVQVSLEEQG